MILSYHDFLVILSIPAGIQSGGDEQTLKQVDRIRSSTRPFDYEVT
jgi:hypothetical protein